MIKPKLKPFCTFQSHVRHYSQTIICIDVAYVLTASLVARTLPSPALAHVLRGHWGLSLCRRRRGGHEVAWSGRYQGTRHVAICGRIRCGALVRSLGVRIRDLPLYHDLPKVLGHMANAASTVAARVALPTRCWCGHVGICDCGG